MATRSLGLLNPVRGQRFSRENDFIRMGYVFPRKNLLQGLSGRAGGYTSAIPL